MYQYMTENAKDVLTADNDEGKRKVLTDNYAFLMESSSIEYIQERECNLTQIGGLLDQKGYGIAMRKNASYRNELSGAVLKLQEMGVLTALKNKWWQEKGGGGRCQEDSSGGQAEELGLANVGGIFLVLVVGVALSFVCTTSEFLYSLIMDIRAKQASIKSRLNNEMKFIMNFGCSSKPTNIIHE
ncbi:glutamate receptor ionotropic, kainate 2-like [Copidosoma floridanum]|uniref:glutamate receptor ionotropic, kainate 2-like n=1 Tax=Copidosoma floridanum TaxID=29053 RepID=UPI0006C9B43C|nr:glutamate receptor ionotropic, kainate 2-like [Copidosoma floridanum]